MQVSETFQRLDSVKKQHILDVAYEEFTHNSYEHASTNQIAKKAGIAKGTLFNYFTSKENLLHYLIDHALELMNQAYFANINWEERDFFKRLINFSDMKGENYYVNKFAFDFIAYVFVNLDQYIALHPQLAQAYAQYEQEITNVLTKNIDLSKFRDDINSEKALKLIYWSIEGYRQDTENKYKHSDFSDLTEEDIASLYKEYEEYMQILKQVYYK